MAHRLFTVEFKVKVIHQWYHANGENKCGTAKHFRVDPKCVYEWLQKEDKLKKLKGYAKKKYFYIVVYLLR